MNGALILIVEDDPALRLSTQLTLESTGYRTLTAADGEQALELIRSQRPDLVLLDIYLPGMDGFEVLQRLRQDPQTAHTFVTLISGVYTDSESQVHALEQGADGILARPISNRELLAHLQALLRLKAAQDALRQSERQFATLAENSPDLMVRFDLNLRHIFINRALEKLTGIPRQEYLGKTNEELGMPPDRVELWNHELRQVIELGLPRIFSFEYTGADGVSRVYEANVAPEFDDYGRVCSLISVVRDITARVKAEAALREYAATLEAEVNRRTEALQQAQEAMIRQEKLAVLGQLAGSVGHELRNPLAVINNAVYYLRAVLPQADEKVHQYLDMIQQEVYTAEKIINDLLNFSRLKGGEPEPVDLAEVVKRALLRLEIPEGIQVHVDLPPDLPQIRADALQLEQVVTNLATNAVQAMPQGGELWIAAQAADGELRLAVRDSGVGIPPENMPHIFEPLFTTRARGIGLGLAVCKRLVEAHGGRIEVVSQPGQGATFTVILPRQPEGDR